MNIDPRARDLAEARQNMAAQGSSLNPDWDSLSEKSKEALLGEAAEWLQAATEAGVAPLAERTTDKHNAVWLDDDGQLWGEYQTLPSSRGDAILRLVWERDECSSKHALEDQGVRFRLIGWSQ